MRKILFRGQKVDTKEWVYGDLLQLCGGCVIYHGSKTDADVKENIGSVIEFYKNEISIVIPETVGQFTVLTDKNGVRIFSDDLLKDGKEDVFRVYQIAGGFCVKSSVWKTDTKEWISSDILIAASLTDAQMQSYILESCEVVGNIHDKHVL